jgi:Mycothiol maleylpyruvate isomerase N-terminal domain
MGTDLDYLAHLARESARFGEVLRGLAADAAVPACPDWNADDLLWHLGGVQWFWGTVVREGLPGAAVGELAPERPPDRAGLAAFYERVSRDLGTALAEAPPETGVDVVRRSDRRVHSPPAGPRGADSPGGRRGGGRRPFAYGPGPGGRRSG